MATMFLADVGLFIKSDTSENFNIIFVNLEDADSNGFFSEVGSK